MVEFCSGRMNQIVMIPFAPIFDLVILVFLVVRHFRFTANNLARVD